MKKSNVFITLILSLFFVAALDSCKKCENEPPRARILNNGTDVVSAQIQTTGGNTENINNIDTATATAYREFAAGEITFTIKRNGTDYVKVDTLANCFDYDIAISDANVITTTAIDRN